MVFATDEHILCKLNYFICNKKGEKQEKFMWHLYKLDGTIVFQHDAKVIECLSIINEKDYKVASTSYSNVDDVEQRVIILQQKSNLSHRTEKQYLL